MNKGHLDIIRDRKQLMEAAPDLLAACKAAENHLLTLHKYTGASRSGEIAAMCSAAIAKAKGTGK